MLLKEHVQRQSDAMRETFRRVPTMAPIDEIAPLITHVLAEALAAPDVAEEVWRAGVSPLGQRVIQDFPAEGEQLIAYLDSVAQSIEDFAAWVKEIEILHLTRVPATDD